MPSERIAMKYEEKSIASPGSDTVNVKLVDILSVASGSDLIAVSRPSHIFTPNRQISASMYLIAASRVIVPETLSVFQSSETAHFVIFPSSSFGVVLLDERGMKSTPSSTGVSPEPVNSTLYSDGARMPETLKRYSLRFSLRTDEPITVKSLPFCDSENVTAPFFAVIRSRAAYSSRFAAIETMLLPMYVCSVPASLTAEYVCIGLR